MSDPDEKTRTLPVRPAGGEGSDVAALLPGQTVFEYRIDKMLGGGGFGITYLAQDINLQLPVAIKEYFPGDLAVRAADLSVSVRSSENKAQFQWGLERFLDEARALASFRHPNIVRVLRYFKENGTAYIVMEYESGDPLKRWLAKQPALDQQSLLKIIYPLMDGLEAVHKVNFLHRDIKPDNIYIRADGTPVLLDFGAARRVTGNQDMTNIVSPGFAPFEQYHSKGHQGPWTDVYSLGAVMYWMTTGHKPMESASRVREDSMPKAADTASAVVFGAPLLRAIDWAMTPNETQRPQDVAALRQALLSSDFLKTQTLRAAAVGGNTTVTTVAAQPPAPAMTMATVESKTSASTPVDNALLAYAANSQSIPLNSAENLRKNVLGTIMFLDLVSYSTYSVDQQVQIKALFNELITKAIGGVKESSRIMIDTGDGAAICFLGDPEEALQSALLLRDLLVHKYGRKLSLRVGLHLGPIRMVFDINNRVNVVGDGINVAQRIMDFSKPNQIVVSRAYYDVISRITDTAASLFDYLGPHMDKHLRSHEIYAVLDPNAAPPAPAERNMEFEHTASFAALASLTPEMAHDIENELAKAIGPLAKVLVKKALPRTVSAQGLRDLLAVSIPDATAREAFLKPRNASAPVHSAPHGASGTRTGSTGSTSSNLSRSVSMPASQMARGDASRLPTSLPTGQTGHSRPSTSSFPSSRSSVSSPSSHSSPSATSINVHTFSAEVQAQLERALSLYIGPLAKTLVRKEAGRQPAFSGLVQALAQHIDKADDRAKFVAAAKKLHAGH
ncbi:Serine/threonine protein kinase [Polaromonas sp. YR568]|uniref:protein kinase domain-containing protein n=1 Tax=Polaromonas sp. YR568 TaxID=1855301 RepID=UPI0008EA4845|nr:protein kinase [Polaromonas sp. YR568]SFU28363.1 Serine/threonine protein kinase [Polaromonas sp. YR568]